MEQIDEWRNLAAFAPAIKERDAEIIDLLTQAGIVVPASVASIGPDERKWAGIVAVTVLFHFPAGAYA